MSVLKIKDAEGNWVGVTAIKGEQGLPGISPSINVTTNTNNTYKLRIVTEDREFVTPNLKGSGGSGSSSNISSELGTIDNYKDFEGKNIPTYNSNMPPLKCFEGGTTYVFDKEVTMLIYDGGIDENGNTDIDKYISFTGKEITVPTSYTGFLTDYVIVNPVPKQPWDTWENPNIVKFLDYTDSRWLKEWHPTFAANGVTVKTRWCAFPNLKLDHPSGSQYSNPWKSGDAWVSQKISINKLNEPYIKKGEMDIAVYNRNDFPFILDEPVEYRGYDTTLKEFSNPTTISYPSAQWEEMKNKYPQFRTGEEYTLEGMDLPCYVGGEIVDGNIQPVDFNNGNEVLMAEAEREKEMLALDGVRGAEYDRCYDMVIASKDKVDRHLAKFNAKPVAPAMYVGLEPLKNYTIESLAGDCALVLSTNKTKKHITKEETIIYPTTTKVVSVSKKDANNVGSVGGGVVGGVVTGGSKLDNGTSIVYSYIDDTKEPLGSIEVPCALSCPTVYLRKGESYTFQVEDENAMYGIYVCCWQEEDYAGIKIVEGIEPYSLLMEERMASGATKFNIKTYWTPELYWTVDNNEIMQEFNIKLCDNTAEKDYCRYLTSETIKHFDLDEFTMVGHSHSLSSISDLDELKATIPKMILSTSTLADGESELAENTFHFVYAD